MRKATVLESTTFSNISRFQKEFINMFTLATGLTGLDTINMKWRIEMFYMFKYTAICLSTVNKSIKHYHKDTKQ